MSKTVPPIVPPGPDHPTRHVQRVNNILSSLVLTAASAPDRKKFGDLLDSLHRGLAELPTPERADGRCSRAGRTAIIYSSLVSLLHYMRTPHAAADLEPRVSALESIVLATPLAPPYRIVGDEGVGFALEIAPE